jgi:hypothetical protein
MLHLRTEMESSLRNVVTYQKAGGGGYGNSNDVDSNWYWIYSHLVYSHHRLQ